MNVKLSFLLILLLAILLRVVALGSFPSGMTWDEAAIGYNAYGIVTNHRDEWLHRMPITFQSFGDYKSPLGIYITSFFVWVGSLTPLMVRLPVAISGIVLVVTTYFLTRELTRGKSPWIALLSMMLVAVSPWAIHFSRIAFESMFACTLIALGVLFFLYWVRTTRIWHLVFSICFFAMSVYAYHSAKVVAPLIALTLVTMYFPSIRKNIRQSMVVLAIGFALLIPLGYASLFGKANERALSTTILSQRNPLQQFAKNYVTLLSPAFVLGGDDITYRHSTRRMGVLLLPEFLLFLIFLVMVLRTARLRRFRFLAIVILIGLIPAALGTEVPHANRALLVLPWLQIASSLALVGISPQRVRRFVGVSVVVLSLFGLFTYLRTYQRVYTQSVALSDFGYGYDELISYLRTQEGTVDRVYLTDHYGQTYIYLLFFKRLTPIEYRQGGLANYTITKDPYHQGGARENVLVVGTDEEIPPEATVVKEIRYPDGKIAFQVVKL